MRRFALLSLLLIPLMQGCVSSVTDQQISDEQARAQNQYTLLQPVHLPRGDGPAGCGAQAFAAAAAYVDHRIDAEAMCRQLPWGSTGATAPEIMIAARRRGLGAALRKGTWSDLREAISRGRPALVLFDSRKEVHYLLFGQVRAGEKVYHWAVVTGLSDAQHRILIAAPGDGDYALNQADFESRWSETDHCLIEIFPGKAGA